MADKAVFEGSTSFDAETDATYLVQTYAGLDTPSEYKGFIYAHWLRSLRYGNEHFKKIDAGAYYYNMTKEIDRILEDKICEVRLAVLDDDKDVILGFSACRGSALDFVYVQKDQRRQGIGKSLLPDHIADITSLTKIGIALWQTKYKHWKFNPYI